MTEFDVSMGAEDAVEATELPTRLKHRLLGAVEEHGLTVDQTETLVEATVARYEDTRVDPLDPVGTVSAQSIGEPGTQMSVPSDERIVVRRDGETDVTDIGPLVDDVMADRETRSVGDHEVALADGHLEVLSLRDDERVAWKPVEEVSRHDTPDELLEFTLESGRSVRATKAHSFVTEKDGELVPVRGDSLSPGDELPVVGNFDSTAGEANFDELFVPSKTLTDGGATTHNGQRTGDDTVLGTASWDRIESVETVASDHEYVYDVSVEGLETFTTAAGVVTHNTMNTFHYAGVAEIDVTQGLPRLIELVDARKEPDTPTMQVFLEEAYADDREKAHEVVWKLEATRILQLGDISTNVAEMRVQVDLNEETLEERMLTAEEVEETIGAELGVDTVRQGSAIQFGPAEPSYRDLLQLVEELRDVVFKGIEDVSRVVIRKEDTDNGEEFVLWTEGSAFGEALDIEGVDASRTTTNNIHEVYRNLGVEAAREAIINETMETLEEQGLDDVNVRHLMLVADIMTNRGEIESIGRHGISGSKDSVLARAAFEVTVNHLLDAAVHGEVDDLDGVTENVIVGKPIKLGTGDVELRMGSLSEDEAAD